MKSTPLSVATFAFRTMILFLSIAVVIVTGLLAKHAKLFGLSYVASIIAIVSNFPIVFLVYKKPSSLPDVPVVVSALANCLVAGILITSGMVVLFSKQNKLNDESEILLGRASADLQFSVAGFYVGLAVLDCLESCQNGQRRTEYGNRAEV